MSKHEGIVRCEKTGKCPKGKARGCMIIYPHYKSQCEPCPIFPEVECIPIPPLLLCPFCGSTNIDPTFWHSNDGKCGPGCSDCGATAETIEKWNTRTD